MFNELVFLMVMLFFVYPDIPEDEARLFTENLDKWNDMSEDEVRIFSK